MKKRTLLVPAAVILVGASGYLGGAMLAAHAQEGAPSAGGRSSATTYAEDLPPVTRLENGGTVGGWRLATPVDERPDYVETRIDGKVGYLKRTDIDDGFVLPDGALEGPVDVTDELAQAQRTTTDGTVQPNARGERWAPVYDESGVKVIGRQLLDPVK